MTNEDIARSLQTGPSGLSRTVAKQSLEKYGTNLYLAYLSRISVWKLVVAQFGNRMVLVLALAATVSDVLGCWASFFYCQLYISEKSK